MNCNTEIVRRIWQDNGCGEHIEVGQDGDLLGLIEIKQKEADGKISSRITVEVDAARHLAQSLYAFADELSEEDAK
jgi:hypothetical protein